MRVESHEAGMHRKIARGLRIAAGVSAALLVAAAIFWRDWLPFMLSGGVLAFSLVGLAMGRPMRRSMAHYGEMPLELDAAPAVGGRLSGRIGFKAGASVPQRVGVVLSCGLATEDSGIRAQPGRWEQRVTVQREGGAAWVPIAFDLPPGLPGSGERPEGTGDAYAAWHLQVSAEEADRPPLCVYYSLDVAPAAGNIR